MTAASYSGEQDAYGNTDFSYQTGFHVTAVFNPPGGCIALYTNGLLAGINAALTVPMSAVNDIYSFIGKSLYSGDPYPDLILDEFRIYSGALNADEIAATQALGSGGLLSQDSPVMGVSASGAGLTLSWPLASTGFTLQSRTNLILGDWVAVQAPAPQIVGNRRLVTIPISNSAEYYRLQK
jgi:hypothetical protein